MKLAEFAEAQGFPEADLAKYGLHPGQGGIVIPYYDGTGNEYIKQRICMDAGGEKGLRWTAGEAEIIPYGLHRPVAFSRGFAWIVERESDCWALWSHDIPALGLPGAAPKTLLVDHLTGATRIAVVDQDGRFAQRVAERLYGQGFAGIVLAVAVKGPHRLMLADPAEFRSHLATAYRQARVLPRPATLAPAKSSSMSAADLLDAEVEEVDWLVDGLIPAAGVALVAAKPKVGKSALVRNLALAVARGNRFLGRRCKGGTVLWLALEEKRHLVLATFKALGLQRQDPIRFHFGSAPENAMAWLRNECDAHTVALVVIDTWHKFTLVENINDYSQVNRANEPLMRLAEKGIGQVWVHHNNKGESTNGDEILGSSALFAAADTVLLLRRANDGMRTIRSIQRQGEDLEDTLLVMDPDTLVIASAGSKYTALVDTAKQQIEQYLGAASEPLTREAIASAIEGRRQTVLAALNELLRDCTVSHVSGSGKRGDPSRYALTRFVGTTREPQDLSPSFPVSPPLSDSQRPSLIFDVLKESFENEGTLGTPSLAPETTGNWTGTTMERQEPQEPSEPNEEDLLLKYAENVLWP